MFGDMFYRMRMSSLWVVCYMVFAILFLASLTGCFDSRYVAEKALWHAENKVASLVRQKPQGLSAQDIQEIVKVYRDVVTKAPLDPLAAKAQVVISNLHLIQGNYAEAQKELRNIIQNFSSKGKIASQAYLNIGNIYEAQKRWDDAAGEYNKIIDLYPLSTLGLQMPIYMMQHYQREDDLTGVAVQGVPC